jgi:hypothetical protein
MSKGIDPTTALDETGVDQLQFLIREAGEEARTRRREALVRHMAMMEAAITDAMARPDPSLLK